MYNYTRIRLKLLLTLLIILSFCVGGGPLTAGQVYEQWRMEMPGFIEPPLKYMIGWNVNEVPRNVTIYYDLDGDKKPELVFAHPIIAENHAPKCDGRRRDEEEFHILLTTCPAPKAVDYFITRQYSMFRLLNEKVWSRIFRMVDDNGRHAKRCEGNRRESQSFAPRTIREMRGQSVEPECSAAVDDDFRAHRRRAGFR